MLSDLIKLKPPKPVVTEFYELHRSFIPKGSFRRIYNEVEPYLARNSSRMSCVLGVAAEIYGELPHIEWTPAVASIRDQICRRWPEASIELALVHYYHDSSSNIAWHRDREALDSNIYSLSLGGTRRFCLRARYEAMPARYEVLTFDLHDGDLFIMKVGCQERYEHCIKSIKAYGEPRLVCTMRISSCQRFKGFKA